MYFGNLFCFVFFVILFCIIWFIRLLFLIVFTFSSFAWNKIRTYKWTELLVHFQFVGVTRSKRYLYSFLFSRMKFAFRVVFYKFHFQYLSVHSFVISRWYPQPLCYFFSNQTAYWVSATSKRLGSDMICTSTPLRYITYRVFENLPTEISSANINKL